MARRKKQSGFEELVEVLALLPWQVCLALAPIAWFGFHLLSQLTPPPAAGVNELGGTIYVTMAKTAGMALQYLAPAALILAALMSFVTKRKRSSLLAETKLRTDSQPLLDLSWQQFESLIAAYFESKGYSVTMTAGGADGGVDAIAKKDGETFLIQCKQWRATQVGVSVVRELFGVMAAQGATGAFVVSAGPFTKAAIEFAKGRNIRLVDAHRLVQSSDRTIKTVELNSSSAKPTCPKCGSSMIKRTAKRGANIGSDFWGCSRYPQCRGTTSISSQ
ncbi:MAG: restriction endonuclease [Xanthomonadales bacterium]|nr:restriction endonuclease [Xanthomonadales bacterium]